MSRIASVVIAAVAALFAAGGAAFAAASGQIQSWYPTQGEVIRNGARKTYGQAGTVVNSTASPTSPVNASAGVDLGDGVGFYRPVVSNLPSGYWVEYTAWQTGTVPGVPGTIYTAYFDLDGGASAPYGVLDSLSTRWRSC